MRGGRAVLMAGVALAVFTSQEMWVTFSPVASRVAAELGVSKEAVGLLAIVYPALFLALTLPSGILLDRSFKTWLLFGVATTVAAGILRPLGLHSYAWLLACQTLAAIGQPFLLNAFAPVASRLYPEARGWAVSLLSFSMYLGIITALGTGYIVYTHAGMAGLVAPAAVLSAVSAALVALGAGYLAGARSGSSGGGRAVIAELKSIVGDRILWLLGIVLGLGVALFDNMSIWLETVLSTVGLGSIAGPAVALALLAGLAGIAFIPSRVIGAGRRTLYIRAASLLGVAVYTALALRVSGLGALTLIPLLGLVMLPAYPVIMEWISTFYEKSLHGGASGFIGLVSRVFTVALATAAVAFIGRPSSYFAFLAMLSLAALATALMLPGDR